MKKTIAVDIDDVLADSTESLRVDVNNHLGINLQPDDYRSVQADYWGYYEEVWRTHGVDKNFKLEDVSGIMVEDQSHVPMLAGAEFALMELSKKFHIVFVTSRDPSWEKATKRWINDKLESFDIDVHFTLSSEGQSKSKGEICKNLGANVLIDDNPEHCKSAMQYGVKGILFGEYGWHNNVPEEVMHCVDWPAVLDYFNEQ